MVHGMAIIRFVGLFLFLLGLIAFAVDGTKSLASEELVLTSLAEFWQQVSSRSYESFMKSTIEFWGISFDGLVEYLLALPIWAMLGLLSLFFYWIGRKRTRTSIYIN